MTLDHTSVMVSHHIVRCMSALFIHPVGTGPHGAYMDSSSVRTLRPGYVVLLLSQSLRPDFV